MLLRKTSKLKAQGLGKYDIANRVAKALLEKGIASVTDDANVKCLRREEMTVGEPASNVVATDVVLVLKNRMRMIESFLSQFCSLSYG